MMMRAEFYLTTENRYVTVASLQAHRTFYGSSLMHTKCASDPESSIEPKYSQRTTAVGSNRYIRSFRITQPENITTQA